MKTFHEHHGFEPYELEDQEDEPYQPRCKRCGSTDVRWRQQGGKWVLFSSEPGKIHVCPINDDFDTVPE